MVCKNFLKNIFLIFLFCVSFFFPVNSYGIDFPVTQKVNSRAFVVLDRNTNLVLLGKNEYQRRKMASTTKIMTACIIIENCNLSDVIEVSRSAANIGGSRLGLRLGDKVSIKDLLYGLMLKSGNDCAVALAEYCGGDIDGFATLMNKKATELRFEKYSFLYSSWFR